LTRFTWTTVAAIDGKLDRGLVRVKVKVMPKVKVVTQILNRLFGAKVYKFLAVLSELPNSNCLIFTPFVGQFHLQLLTDFEKFIIN
jgi:hypothetical protein